MLFGGVGNQPGAQSPGKQLSRKNFMSQVGAIETHTIRVIAEPNGPGRYDVVATPFLGGEAVPVPAPSKKEAVLMSSAGLALALVHRLNQEI